MEEILIVNISDYKIATRDGKLITYALGSCVGICLYDSYKKVMGLAHILLPDSGMCNNDVNTKKFANTAIKEMLNEMIKVGAIKRNVVAKIAGGAQMFIKSNIKIGDRNIIAVREQLVELNIPLIAQDVGDTYGRTMECHLDTGLVHIKSISKGVNIL